MLENVETIFDDMHPMMKKLKKASYEKNMKEFRIRYHRFFSEMTAYMEEAQDKTAAARQLSDTFTQRVCEKFAVNGKIRGREQADMNFFMIYYFFPALLLTQSEYARQIADAVCASWGETFVKSPIRYADYDMIHGAFREKIFGIF